MINKECLQCKKIFSIKPYRQSSAFYCSRSCAKIGKKLTEKIRDKISTGHKGINTWSLGIKIPVNIKEKIRASMVRRFDLIGRQSKEERVWNKQKRNKLKRATIKELGGHTFGDWELLKKQYNYTCPCCKLSEPFIGQRSENLTEDHIIPLSKGGSDLIENIQPLCLSCNIKKHTLIIKY